MENGKEDLIFPDDKATRPQKVLDWAKQISDEYKYWVIYELERRKLIKLGRHEDGRIDLQGRPVAWWLKRAVKNEEQQKRIIERSQAV